MAGLTVLSSEFMAVGSAPCPLASGGGAGGGKAWDVLSGTPPAVTPTCNGTSPSDRAALEEAAASRILDISSSTTERLVPLRRDLDEACAGPVLDLVRSNKLGSSGDSTIGVLRTVAMLVALRMSRVKVLRRVVVPSR